MQIDYLKPKNMELKHLTHKEVQALNKNEIIEYIDGKHGSLAINTQQLLVVELANRKQKVPVIITLLFGFVAAVTGVIAVLPTVLSWF